MNINLDTRPDSVNVAAYSGDTLSIKVTAPDSIVSGKIWKAQVRRSKLANSTIDATFQITVPTEPNGPAYLILPAATTASLAALGVQTTDSIVYTGYWDCQLAPPTGTDPVRTIVRGVLTIDGDVTKP